MTLPNRSRHARGPADFARAACAAGRFEVRRAVRVPEDSTGRSEPARRGGRVEGSLPSATPLPTKSRAFSPPSSGLTLDDFSLHNKAFDKILHLIYNL